MKQLAVERINLGINPHILTYRSLCIAKPLKFNHH